MLKSAFSLLELILVVVIIGVVYAMALSSFKVPDKKDINAFSLLTLSTFLRDNYALQDAKLVCFEPCDKCSILVDGVWQDEELDLFDSATVRSYSLDLNGFATQNEYTPHNLDDPYKQACFILHKRPNNSIEPVILEEKGRFIYYQAAYEKTRSYESLGAIQTMYQKSINMIRNEQ